MAITLKATPHMCIFIRLLQHGQAACVAGHGRNIFYCILNLCSGGLNSYIELKYGMFQAQCWAKKCFMWGGNLTYIFEH